MYYMRTHYGRIANACSLTSLWDEAKPLIPTVWVKTFRGGKIMKKNISKIDKRRAIPLIAILALNNTILNSQDNMTVLAQCEAENRIINMVLYLLDDTLNEEDVDY
jgi:hypothetical protein